MKQRRSKILIARIQNGSAMSRAERLSLVVRLSIPGVFTLLATVLMQYIDAAMVGHLGAAEAAAVGIVASSTWLLWGIGSAVFSGFSVLASHEIGAKDYFEARKFLRQGLAAAAAAGTLLGAVGLAVSPFLPGLLGAGNDIAADASAYFAIYTAALPVLFASAVSAAMLKATGNIRLPAVLNALMCFEDVILNLLLIFPSREVSFLGTSLTLLGAGLGVEGAALGTVLAEALTAVLMIYAVCARCPELSIRGERGRFLPERERLRRALKIGIPLGLQHTAMCCAQVLSTMIVASLGTVAIAANSLAVTAESLCYMPGFGVSEAATTLTGQSVGAGRRNLAKSFARMAAVCGMATMTLMGMVMYCLAPEIIGVMTNVGEIVELGAAVLRIEAFAEPMFAASIVICGAFVGAGDTLAPCLINLFSMWAVRLPAAYLLAQTMGLRGVWIAMCCELFFRGALFILRLEKGNWLRLARDDGAARGAAPARGLPERRGEPSRSGRQGG